MAMSSPLSDTQTLLQSMLQRLKLQTHPEKSSIHMQMQAPSLAKLDNESAERSSKVTVYQFGDSVDKQHGRPPSIWTKLDSPWSLQSFNSPAKGISPTYMNSCASSDVIYTNDGEMPICEKLQFSQRRVSDDSCISSVCTTENTTILSTSSPASPIQSWTSSKEHSGSSGVWTEGVGVTKKDDISVADRTHMSRTSKRKWSDPGKKRWTQKVKERWKERHKKERGKQNQDMNEEAKSNHSLTPTNPNENNSTTTFIEEEKHQPINNVPSEAPPSPLDDMGETIYSLGSFNLMEEIFSGVEWAKFFSSGTSSQLESTCVTPDTTPSSISQSPQGELTKGNQFDYKEAQMNSEGFQQDMDITEDTVNQNNQMSDFSLPLFQTFELLKDQSEFFDLGSDQSQRMDLSVSQSENDDQTKHQAHLQDMYQNNQLKTTTEEIVHWSLSSEKSLNPSQLCDSNHTQPEILPLLDLSYLQPKDSSSLELHGPPSRKRGHGTLSRSSSDQSRPEMGPVHNWRDNAMIPLHSLQPVPSLSPASSVSSLQYSISQDSESSVSIETVVKKRRLEDTRRVRFAEEVVFLPPLILSEDDEDSDYDDEDEADVADVDDCKEQPQSRPSIPNWIAVLRTKTKRRPKLKFPQMESTPTKIKSVKLGST